MEILCYLEEMEDDLLHEKIEVVQAYLEAQFPNNSVAYSPGRVGRRLHTFRIDEDSGVAHLARLSKQFLDDHKISEIDGLLQTFRLGDCLREAGKVPVLVTTGGPLLDSQE